jgi:ankyrin repeat protein
MTLQQQRLIELIDAHATTDDFLTLYRYSVTALKPFEQNELLLRACRFGTLAIIQALLSDGHVTVDNCHHPSTGCSPLFIAIRAHQTAIIYYLIHEVHADVNSSTNRDETCLHEAIRQRDLSTVKLLLEHGATVDERHFLLAIKECAHKPTCHIKVISHRLQSLRASTSASIQKKTRKIPS